MPRGGWSFYPSEAVWSRLIKAIVLARPLQVAMQLLGDRLIRAGHVMCVCR